MRVTMLDYGAGNLHSLGKALTLSGADVRLESDAARVLDGDVLVLPGVGAFGPAARQVSPARRAIRDAILDGHPTIGICLGMQLLFDASEEAAGDGLGVIPGRVTRLEARCVPHMGWNTVAGDRWFYFAHGFACRPEDASSVEAWCEHDGDRFPAVVRVARTIGVQFHPEKSGSRGVALLASVLREVACS